MIGVLNPIFYMHVYTVYYKFYRITTRTIITIKICHFGFRQDSVFYRSYRVLGPLALTHLWKGVERGWWWGEGDLGASRREGLDAHRNRDKTCRNCKLRLDRRELYKNNNKMLQESGIFTNNRMYQTWDVIQIKNNVDKVDLFFLSTSLTSVHVLNIDVWAKYCNINILT
jgi:hypothetical protein